MWDLDHKENWGLKNWCFWTVVLEKTLESPLDCKEIQPINPKGNQSWIFIGRTDAEAEAPILWPLHSKNWLIGRDPDAGQDWRQEEKGMIEDEMVGWHHRLDGHEFEQALGVGDGQGSLVCCSPWGCKESDTTERLNWTKVSVIKSLNMTKGFPGGSVVKNPPANSGDAHSIPGSGRSLGIRNGNPVQYSCLEKSMDRGAWQGTVHGVTKSWTRLSNWACNSRAWPNQKSSWMRPDLPEVSLLLALKECCHVWSGQVAQTWGWPAGAKTDGN